MKKIINIFGCICLMTVPIFSQELSRKQVIEGSRQKVTVEEKINVKPILLSDRLEKLDTWSAFGTDALMNENAFYKIAENSQLYSTRIYDGEDNSIEIFFASLGLIGILAGSVMLLIAGVIYLVDDSLPEAELYALIGFTGVVGGGYIIINTFDLDTEESDYQRAGDVNRKLVVQIGKQF